MYNIVRQQNLLVLEERLLRLEENLHNAPPRRNIDHEAIMRRTQVTAPKLTTMKKNEAPKSRNEERSMKQQSPL